MLHSTLGSYSYIFESSRMFCMDFPFFGSGSRYFLEPDPLSLFLFGQDDSTYYLHTMKYPFTDKMIKTGINGISLNISCSQGRIKGNCGFFIAERIEMCFSSLRKRMNTFHKIWPCGLKLSLFVPWTVEQVFTSQANYLLVFYRNWQNIYHGQWYETGLLWTSHLPLNCVCACVCVRMCVHFLFLSHQKMWVITRTKTFLWFKHHAN